MAPIGVIVFFGIFFLALFGGAGYWLSKEDKLKGFLLICIGIGFALGTIIYGVRMSNCMNGAKMYGNKSMTYNNGKVSYYTPRSNARIRCEDTYGITIGYGFKVGVISFAISFGCLYGLYKLKEKNKEAIPEKEIKKKPKPKDK